MKNTARLAIAAALLLCTLFCSGCATLALAQLNGKMPHVQADSLTVKVIVAGVQVGSLETKGLAFDANGNLHAAEYHESITTTTGGVQIDATNVLIPPNGAPAPATVATPGIAVAPPAKTN